MNMYSKFSTLISPFSVEGFFHHYYEKNYLHLSRNTPTYYDAILNTDDIDLFFQNKTLPSSHLRVVNNGEELHSGKWTHTNSSTVDNDKLFVFFNQGNTLIINAGDRSILKLINYCADLERELQLRLQFNIYITPVNAQGFAPHYDDHDVFILQTTGTKLWRLYHSPIELPSKKQPHCKHKDKYELGTPAFEVELKPGDLLYIPRGLIHDASTTDTASVHITLGLHPNYWFELLREVADLAEDKAEFRRAVPNALMDEAYQHQFKEEFRQRLQALIDNLDVDELLARKSEQYITNKRSEDQNRFKDSIQLNKLNLNSVLSRRENILFKVDKDAENVYVKFYKKKLDFPRFVEPSLNTLFQDKCFAVKDIGGLITNEGKIDLATKFIQEGFLKIENINAET
jgi:hypothetical protein